MPENARFSRSKSLTSPMKYRMAGYSPSGYSCAIWNCFCSSREKITKRLTCGHCAKMVLVSSLPSDPVPPVMRMDLWFNISLNK